MSDSISMAFAASTLEISEQELLELIDQGAIKCNKNGVIIKSLLKYKRLLKNKPKIKKKKETVDFLKVKTKIRNINGQLFVLGSSGY